MQPHALYICYFWLSEPLVQTQVLPYLREIQRHGVKVFLLTFERENLPAGTIEAERKRLADEGISWYFLRYHKTPSVPATAFDIVTGALRVMQIARDEKIDIFHARSYIPAIMGAIAKTFCGGKLLFDIRGFFPEEYTDAGIWKEDGLLYKAAKLVEKWLFRKADGFVVLTEKAREILFPESKASGFDKHGRPVEVIPCCVDLERFASATDEARAKMRRQLNIEDRFVIAYLGSFGGWYLTDEIFDFFSRAHESDPSVFIMVLTQHEKELVTSRLTSAGFSESDFFVDSVSPVEIPQYLNAADAGLSLIKSCYSKQASSPTKNAEYLAAGLPLIANSGVGDVDALVEENSVGTIINASSDPQSALDIASAVERSRCREVAKNEFDLEQIGGARYRRLYRRLLNYND